MNPIMPKESLHQLCMLSKKIVLVVSSWRDCKAQQSTSSQSPQAYVPAILAIHEPESSLCPGCLL